MDNQELKEALLSEEPVIYKSNSGFEAEYQCVSGIIYRKNKQKDKDKRLIDISAEITDMNGKSVTICDPKNLRRKENTKCEE